MVELYGFYFYDSPYSLCVSVKFSGWAFLEEVDELKPIW